MSIRFGFSSKVQILVLVPFYWSYGGWVRFDSEIYVIVRFERSWIGQVKFEFGSIITFEVQPPLAFIVLGLVSNFIHLDYTVKIQQHKKIIKQTFYDKSVTCTFGKSKYECITNLC